MPTIKTSPGQVGDSFTGADLNVASILVWGKMARLQLSGHPDAKRWLDGCLARPAYRLVRDRASRKMIRTIVQYQSAGRRLNVAGTKFCNRSATTTRPRT